MSKVFLNIPDNIEETILQCESEQFTTVYRAITHTGILTPRDFYPTFDDYFQKERILIAKTKGGMAEIVASQKDYTNKLDYYAVSLSTSKQSLKDKFWRRKKIIYPMIAVGHTDKDKGVSYLNGENHVSYYLFDYEDVKKNPFKDFKKDECVNE